MSEYKIEERFFSDDVFKRVKCDFKGLFSFISQSGGLCEFQIRGKNKFNLYYWGNSLAKVIVKSKGRYDIEINNSFEPLKIMGVDERNYDNFSESKNYVKFHLQKKHLKSFFPKPI